MQLLDTNVVSELRKIPGGHADPRVVAWEEQVDAESLYLSVVVLHELEVGILRLGRHDLAQSSILRTWMRDYVLPEFRDRILPIDAAIALRCAELQAGGTRPILDTFIAATAYVHGMILVTRNVDDFKGTGVELINPWDA